MAMGSYFWTSTISLDNELLFMGPCATQGRHETRKSIRQATMKQKAEELRVFVLIHDTS